MSPFQGDQCEKCQPFFVGEPSKGCVSCLEFCHGHSDTCIAAEVAARYNVSEVSVGTDCVPEMVRWVDTRWLVAGS